MPLNDPKVFLLEMQLKTQGKVTGDSTKKQGGTGFSAGLRCHAFNYQVAQQFDAGSGQLTGRRTHTPITIVREVDKASPLLWSALCTNEGFKTATLSFARPSADGNFAVAHTIVLTDGAIVSIRPAGIQDGKKCEELTLTYEETKVDGALREIPAGLERRWYGPSGW
jgi:type VI secretion system secreted protein Hcp